MSSGNVQVSGEPLACSGLMPLIDDYAKAVHNGDDDACVVLRRTIEANLEQLDQPNAIAAAQEEVKRLRELLSASYRLSIAQELVICNAVRVAYVQGYRDSDSKEKIRGSQIENTMGYQCVREINALSDAAASHGIDAARAIERAATIAAMRRCAEMVDQMNCWPGASASVIDEAEYFALTDIANAIRAESARLEAEK